MLHQDRFELVFEYDDDNNHSDLHQYLKATKSFKRPEDGYFLRAESFYNVATLMDETGYLQGYGGKSLHQQSHGESFMATLVAVLQATTNALISADSEIAFTADNTWRLTSARALVP